MAGMTGIDRRGGGDWNRGRVAPAFPIVRSRAGDLLPDPLGGYSGSAVCPVRSSSRAFGESLPGGGWFHASVCLPRIAQPG